MTELVDWAAVAREVASGLRPHLPEGVHVVAGPGTLLRAWSPHGKWVADLPAYAGDVTDLDEVAQAFAALLDELATEISRLGGDTKFPAFPSPSPPPGYAQASARIDNGALVGSWDLSNGWCFRLPPIPIS
jgi:hypothetical protein